MKRAHVFLLSTLCAAMLNGCNDSGDTNTGHTHSAAIQFAGVVGNEDFSCGTVYSGVGTGSNEYRPEDFRLYVSDLALKTDTGEEIPIDLVQDGAWQYENVALLDFETGSENGCNGTPETNDQVIGTYQAPTEGNIVGLCFNLGIPFELNHLESASSPSPLNASGMYWMWLSGHKFVRIDGKGDPNGVTPVNFPLHLGSTGCTNDSGDMTDPATSECAYPNTPRVCFDSFDMDSQKVTVDPAAVLATTDFSAADTGVPPGCMSGNSDPDCINVIPKFGINFVADDGVNEPSTYPADQAFFGVAAK